MYWRFESAGTSRTGVGKYLSYLGKALILCNWSDKAQDFSITLILFKSDNGPLGAVYVLRNAIRPPVL